ncbi:MAG: winged helix-turn-helix transcriptional regulator [Archangium sp.]
MTKQVVAEGCAAEPFLKFIASEWTSHIVHSLATHGTQRFGVLRRSLPSGVSARVLSARLKALEAAGYVSRHAIAGRVKTVEYSLTEAGRAVDAMLRSSPMLRR